MKIIVLTLLCALVMACGKSAPGAAAASNGSSIKVVNGDFEQSGASVAVPVPGWMMQQHAGAPAYTLALDQDVFAGGHTSARLVRNTPQVYGSITQHVVVGPYAGRTIRLSAKLKSKDVGPGGWKLYIFCNGVEYSKGLTGTADWQEQSVDLKLPPMAADATIGATLLDAGTGWIDDVQLRVVD